MTDSDDEDEEEEYESVFLSLNPITNASGSAYVQLGLSGNENFDDDEFDGGKKTTKIFVSVFGPKKTTTRQQDERVSKTRGTIDVSVKVASFATKTRAISSSVSSASLSDVEIDFTEKVAKCLGGVVVLESFPKAVVEVRCVVADAHGDELRGLILAASAALMHARVETRDVLCACTAVIDEDGEVRLVEDYNNSSSGGRKTSKNKKAVGAVTVAYMPRVKKVTNVLSVGRWENANDLKKAEEVAMHGCESVAEIIKAAF